MQGRSLAAPVAMAHDRDPFVPSPEQMELWPEESGNDINGLGQPELRRPRHVYWHDPAATPHGPLQEYFYKQNPHPLVDAARAERQVALSEPLAPLAAEAVERAPAKWVEGVRQTALEGGGDVVGIAEIRNEWVYQGQEMPYRWVLIIGVAHDYEQISQAPGPASAAEVIRQYTRGNRAAKALASWLRSQGHEAVPHGGPMAGPITMIPAAIAAGMGELGKHGSLIHRELGASFRLAAVFTDLPLQPDEPETFGVDDFCTLCRLCTDACPPDAIFEEKQLVRGERRWYVDFDKCLPYFNENLGCAVCIAVCPWSMPGVAERLVVKLARRKRE